ncbi:MAG: IS1634 family transposase, partial [Thermodesulfobacteriota bacterium]
KNKTYKARFLAESYWDKEKKQPRNRIIANLSSLPLEMIETIRAHLKGGTQLSVKQLGVDKAYDHGQVAAFWGLAKDAGLITLLEKHLKTNAGKVLAMVINRIADPKAKYSLRDWLSTTTLPKLLGKDLAHFHYNCCYEALDSLYEKQEEIEDGLRGEPATLLLYDLTSSYYEGNGADDLLNFGYNRDKKKGKKQIVIGLVTDKKGKPLSVEVLPGNTGDKGVLKERVDSLKQRFGVKEVIIVFDRGMATAPNKLALGEKGIDYITALTPDEVKQLAADNQELQLGLFDKKDLLQIKIIRETKERERYEEKLILCRSEEKAKKDNKQFAALVKKTEGKLKMIQGMIAKGRLKDPIKIAKRVGKWINHWKVGKYFETKIAKEHLSYQKKEIEFGKQDMLSGMYVLATSTDKLKPKEIQEAYKSLSKVEADFRVLKSSLKVRPIYHWKEERIKAHVFICFLALWLRWHFEKRLEPMWKNHTRSQVEGELKKLKVLYLAPKSVLKKPFLTKTTKLQQQIFNLLGFPMPHLSS